MYFDPAPPFEIALLIVIGFYVVVGILAAVVYKVGKRIEGRMKKRSRPNFWQKYGNS